MLSLGANGSINRYSVVISSRMRTPSTATGAQQRPGHTGTQDNVVHKTKPGKPANASHWLRRVCFIHTREYGAAINKDVGADREGLQNKP